MGLFCAHEYPVNPFTYGSQNWRLYDRLKDGPIRNSEIYSQLHLLKYTSRLSDVRAFLETEGYEIAKKLIGGGVYEYRIKKMVGAI